MEHQTDHVAPSLTLLDFTPLHSDVLFSGILCSSPLLASPLLSSSLPYSNLLFHIRHSPSQGHSLCQRVLHVSLIASLQQTFMGSRLAPEMKFIVTCNVLMDDRKLRSGVKVLRPWQKLWHRHPECTGSIDRGEGERKKNKRKCGGCIVIGWCIDW